jgi:hypothetical protein
MGGKLRYDYTLLKSICDDGGVTLLIDYTNMFVTRDTRIIGKCILCENMFNKSLNKLHKQKNFGCETCAKINNHVIFLKQNAAKNLGYKYEIWIYNSNGELVEFYD